MVTFHALTKWADPELYIWRSGKQDSNLDVDNSLPHLSNSDEKGLVLFRSELDHQNYEYTHLIHLILPKCFSKRFAELGLSPLRQLALEISDNSGYLKDMGITTIQLVPVSEFAGDESWGYGPTFYYAVESTCCSSGDDPDDLKYFVDTCHSNGLAVLLDVVYNHTRNTRTIVDSHMPGWYVKRPGSGHGWEFLYKLRAAIHALDPQRLMIAEHLPNYWPLTNYGGPMDSQWCDNFHDRMVDGCRGGDVMPSLADSIKITQTNCNQWYEATNYPESHEEVGNVNDRIANVGGYGQGLRRNKVAAAATLMSRGIPMWFMGAESGEWRQFRYGSDDTLPIEEYMTDEQKLKVRNWWNTLCKLRRGNPKIEGSSPVNVHFAQEEMLAFSRGIGEDFFVVLNFGGRSMWRPLSELNLPEGEYKELWNSTWPDFSVESEDIQTNGGWHAHLKRENWLNIPDYGAVILEKV